MYRLKLLESFKVVIHYQSHWQAPKCINIVINVSYSMSGICKEFIVHFINLGSFHVCKGGQGRLDVVS